MNPDAVREAVIEGFDVHAVSLIKFITARIQLATAQFCSDASMKLFDNGTRVFDESETRV